MNSYFTAWNTWLGKRMFLLVLSALATGYFISVGNSPWLRTLVIALFAYMTFVTSLETSLRKFIEVLSHPWISFWILALVHIVTPLVAWAAGYLFFPADHYTRLGYLISASIPVGVTSIIWTSLTKGDIPVSLVTVTLDTLIAPALLPLLFALAVGQAFSIDYIQMALQLLWMITVPSIVGMVLHDSIGESTITFAKGFGGFTSKIALFAVIALNAAIVAPTIAWSPAVLKMIGVTLFMVASGYIIGYIGSFALKNRSHKTTVAIIYCVGLRNISAGLVLALTHFPPQVAVPMTLFILFQQPLASAIPYLYQDNDNCN